MDKILSILSPIGDTLHSIGAEPLVHQKVDQTIALLNYMLPTVFFVFGDLILLLFDVL